MAEVCKAPFGECDEVVELATETAVIGLDDAVEAAGCDAPTARRERHGGQARIARVEPEELPPRGHVPDTRGSRPCRHEPAVVGAEGRVAHDPAMVQRPDVTARAGIPDASIVVVTRRHEVPTVRAESDRVQPLAVADEWRQSGLAARGVPDLRDGVRAG